VAKRVSFRAHFGVDADLTRHDAIHTRRFNGAAHAFPGTRWPARLFSHYQTRTFRKPRASNVTAALQAQPMSDRVLFSIGGTSAVLVLAVLVLLWNV
jgi:hypothetical protein